MEKERVSRFPLGCSYLLNKRKEKKSGLTLHKINAPSLKKGS